jgi:tRNA modification GTPase
LPTIIKQKELICALATPPGKGALAIVRLSGKDALKLAKQIMHQSLLAREACYTSFYSEDNEVIDQGLAIYFQSPASFTGEDVVEFQCHGNPLIAELLLKTLCSLGARLATAGEFSLRAFLNNKIDLAQAEAIADLINSTTEQGARTATRSLQGAFSERVQEVLTQLVQLRMHIEAHLDFPDEEIDPQLIEQLQFKVKNIDEYLKELLQQAKLGERLQSGATVAIAGRPNAGKSSLLNTLAQSDVAIVTEIPGTTRDPLNADIEIQGMPVRLIDTAGLRDTKDVVEVKGIERAQQVLGQADVILWLTDVTDKDAQNIPDDLDTNKVIFVYNKIDLQPGDNKQQNIPDNVFISAKAQLGIDELIRQLSVKLSGPDALQEQGDTPFLARSRHVIALQQAQQNIRSALVRITNCQELELAAEDMRLAQQNLGEITGEFTPDDLLGKIFSEFCIGK